ncbi:YciI-like protein [soil metagenome]
MHYLLFYEKGAGYAERQKPFAEAHRTYLDGLVASGHLILGGSMEDPVDGSAILLFEAGSAAAVGGFAKGDPYVRNGIVAKWWVRKWDVVIGAYLTG